MKTNYLLSTIIAAASLACAGIAPAQAVVVDGTSSIYAVFNNNGSPGGGGANTPAVLGSSFAAGAGNVFTFSATGAVNCCGGQPDITPDGGPNGMNVQGTNGFSGLSGSSNIPLVGVFVNIDGNPAPGALSFNSSAPTSLSPLLNQVFYIGDGRSGYHDPNGTILTFTAPSTATRLYLGVIDANGFNALTGYYEDNRGSFDVAVNLTVASAVPEPTTWAMMLLGFAATGFMAYRRRNRVSALA